MNYYHDHHRPAPSREYARCNRPVRGTDRRCGEILEHLSNPFTGQVRYDVCPACDQGRARTRWLAPEAPLPPPDPQEVAWSERAFKAASARAQADAALRQEVIDALVAWYRSTGRAPTYAEMGHKGTPSVPGLRSISLVNRLFRNPRMALVAAGIPRNRRGDSATVTGTTPRKRPRVALGHLFAPTPNTIARSTRPSHPASS